MRRGSIWGGGRDRQANIHGRAHSATLAHARQERKNIDRSVRVVGNPDEIRTMNLLNTSLQHQAAR